MLSAKGVPFAHRAARQMTKADYAYYDYIVCMDRSNIRWMQRIIGEDTEGKVSLMMAWKGRSEWLQVKEYGRDVADPWYTGDFEEAYNDILEGCRGMVRELIIKNYELRITN